MTFVLPYRQTFDREDFIVAPCNVEAVTWMDLQGCWPLGGAWFRCRYEGIRWAPIA